MDEYKVEFKQREWHRHGLTYEDPMEALASTAESFIGAKGFGSITEVRCIRLLNGKQVENQWELKIC